jgi:hypothetical protein
MASTFQDKFSRVDGPIGADYLIPCGLVSISDESVIPVGLSGLSPETYLPTREKTQVLYTASAMDSADAVIRGVWARDVDQVTTVIGITGDPSFTLLARMSKDPLIVDLGGDEDPHCYDQGYGLRVTCPLDRSAPVLKIVKFQATRRAPGLNRPASTEPDGATVLASITLQAADLNVEPGWMTPTATTVPSGPIPYQGFWQDMRLRIRRADSEVVLEAFLNDRHLNTPILTFTDKQDPLWGVIGYPGFDFISAITDVQPSGVSPYDLVGEPLMRCGLFAVQTVKDFAKPIMANPDNFFTYDEVTKRVITLVEKNGDAKYTATTAGLTKMQTYLQFVLDAEAHIIRAVGFWRWLWRSSSVYLQNGIAVYELPSDCGIIDVIRPGNYSGPALSRVEAKLFRSRVGSVAGSSGPPRIWVDQGESVNNRKQILLFPTPPVATQNNSQSTQFPNGIPNEISLVVDPYIQVEYYARRVRPTTPAQQIPYIPQEHIDVLIWGAAAHAMILDTDAENTAATQRVFDAKLATLVREQMRGATNEPQVVRDITQFGPGIGLPLLRVDQLNGLGWLP